MAQIAKKEEANAGIAKWKNSNKQHLNAQWQEDSGARISDRRGDEYTPFEQEERQIHSHRLGSLSNQTDCVPQLSDCGC